MAIAAVTYSFTTATTAVAAQVNQDFTDVVTFLNSNVIHIDGSKTMTGQLALLAADPTTANQATRKSYVDQNARYKGAGNRPSVALSGSLPSTDTQLLIKTGEDVATTDALGAVAVNFTNAFPTNVASIFVTIADGSLFNNSTGVGASGHASAYVITQATTAGFVVKFGGTPNPLASTSLAFSWLAFGN